MSVPYQFPHHAPRAMSAATALSDGIAETNPAGTPDAVPAPGSWPWRRAALLASVAVQLITISALVSADPIPATWTALLAVAPAPLALVAAFTPAAAARLAAPLAVVVLVTGIVGQVTHTGLFFLPALAAMAVAALRLWREKA